MSFLYRLPWRQHTTFPRWLQGPPLRRVLDNCATNAVTPATCYLGNVIYNLRKGWYKLLVSDSQASIWKRFTQTRRLFLIAGPCVIESEALCLTIARAVSKTCRKLGIFYVFKASYDKANRTAANSFRGPGLEEGLAILRRVRTELEIPVLTDVHTEAQARSAAQAVDILQIPAFLCRQTDLITAAASTGKIVNLKKGQFLSPTEMGQVVKKAVGAGGRRLLVTERGTSFGYQNLVVDMRSLPILRELGFPVVFDATQSVQLPGGAGDKSGGQRQFAPVLARCAIAAGAQGLSWKRIPTPTTPSAMVPTQSRWPTCPSSSRACCGSKLRCETQSRTPDAVDDR